MLLFPLINVKMPTIVGILTFMSRKKTCSIELSMKKVLLLRGLACEFLTMNTLLKIIPVSVMLFSAGFKESSR